MQKNYFLPEDMSALKQLIEELKEKVKELGKEQGQAAGQSTENFGHDDACQEAVDHERRIVLSRLNELHSIVNHGTVFTPEEPFDKICLGATVELSNGKTYKIGSYMIFADHPITNISYNSPLGRILLNKTEGEEIKLKDQRLTIIRIR